MIEPFLRAMHFRHACKLFDTQRAIPSGMMENILEIARLSPSSFGMEPWRLIVVRDPQLRQRLRGACWNQSQITDASELIIFTTDTDAVRAHSPYVTAMFDRRGLGEEARERYSHIYAAYLAPLEADEVLLENWTAKQCYIACANMMSYAAYHEIDTCPIEGFDKEAIHTILELPPHQKVALILTLGYRVNDPRASMRLSLDQIVSYR